MYPLLSSLPSVPKTLSPQLQTILLATGHIAAGKAAAAVAAFSHITAGNLPKAYELAVVQSLPIVGVARTLHSAAALHAAGFTGASGEAPLSGDALSRGAESFATVYARHGPRVRRRLAGFSPRVERWVVGCVYGEVLCGGLATRRERELGVVVALCADEVAGAQLASHLRGARNVGASEEEVEAVVRMAGVLYGEERAEGAVAVWKSYALER